MKLDRDINPTGKGKYALINMRKINGDPRTPQELAAAILAHPEAVEFGIANAVLPAAEVASHARRMAERFNTLAPSAVRASKRLMRAPGLAELQRVIKEEAEIFGARLRSPEAMEAFQAFFQKRKPDFSKF